MGGGDVASVEVVAGVPVEGSAGLAEGGLRDAAAVVGGDVGAEEPAEGRGAREVVRAGAALRAVPWARSAA